MNIIKPFGPEIGLHSLPEEMSTKLYDICMKQVEKNPSNLYIGSASTSLLEQCKSDILPYLTNLVVEYINSSTSIFTRYAPVKKMQLTCSQFWFNAYKSDEAYEIHKHPFADVVVVTYPKIDLKDIPTNKKSFPPGSIVFNYNGYGAKFGETNFAYTPKTGDVVIFPGDLPHSTIPIYNSESIRISTSTDFHFNDNFYHMNGARQIHR